MAAPSHTQKSFGLYLRCMKKNTTRQALVTAMSMATGVFQMPRST